MAKDQNNELLFEVNLLFKEEKNAIEAFAQIIKFYEILQAFDKSVIRNINAAYIPEYGLENVEYGSLKTRLVQILKAIPDELIQDLEWKKIIGFFLVKAKYRLIKFLSEENKIESREQIKKITDEINNDIKQIGNEHHLLVTEISEYVILNVADDLSKEVNNLKDKELLEYKSKAGNTFVQKGVYINKPKILFELGEKTIVNETTEILKVKKVDLLSDIPKWDFLQSKKPLSAKMLDTEWLNSFHSRQVNIQPEDALAVTLRTIHTYTPSYKSKKTDFEIIKVLSVIGPNDADTQLNIL